jgi:hypothetical protein
LPRLVLIRDGAEEKLVPEARIPLEAELHDLLTNHPGLIPAEDLGFGRTVAVGKETALASGYADLVLLDEFGNVALVEVKKEGNADTRRVVAQLLDYAAAMWGLDIATFEEQVLTPFRARAGLPATDARSLFAKSFPEEVGGREGTESAGGEATTDVRVARLSESLMTGRFTLVVAAPQIPPGVAKVVDYLNSQGLRLFGIEYHYFKEDSLEVLVPRVAVAPSRSVQAHRRPEEQFDRDSFLSRVPEQGRGFIASLLDGAVERGGSLRANPTGNPTILAGRWGKSICAVEPTMLWAGDISKSVPSEPITAMELHLAKAIPGRVPRKAIRYLDLNQQQQAEVAAAIHEACRQYSEMA